MRNLHVLPKFADRWSHLYLEHGRLEKESDALTFYKAEGSIDIPIDQLGLLLLGPGTSLTHAAMHCLAENNTLVCWTGEKGVRLYAHNTGGTHLSTRLLRQAMLYADYEKRIKVVRRMYTKRFPEPLSENLTLEKIRGMEGYRVRSAYKKIAGEIGVEWHGRSYNPNKWDYSDPVNRALSSASACLYGLCHAAILSTGYSPAIGFIHTGKMLSFVYDIADLYKTELTIPVAFRTVKDSDRDIERRVRIACRDLFYEKKLMQRIIPDIGEVLDACDDLKESPGEFEGKIVTMADRAADGSLPWQSECTGSGSTVGEDD
jgi:CRISPR-associated protein Cas1